jgi:hypothetical protein
MYHAVKTDRKSAIMLYTFLHLGIKWKRCQLLVAATYNARKNIAYPLENCQ